MTTGPGARVTSLAVRLGLFTLLLIPSRAQSFQGVSKGGIPETRPTTPANRSDLLSFQARVQATARNVIPAIVAIRGSAGPQQDRDLEAGIHRASGSGVIITSEGLILSQSHVSHGRSEQTGERKPSRHPGDRITVVLSDRRECEAELLGADQALDLSVLRLIKPGSYPHVSVSHSAKVARGDWVLKLGHPHGYRPDRPPVVRLGRVLYENEDMFVTDCLTAPGDSGGPFFDLEGRFLGLIASSLAPSQLNASLYCEDPGRMGPFSATTARLIETYLDPMLRRQIAPYDRSFWSEFVGRYQTARDEEVLPRAEWTQGEATSRSFGKALRVSRPTVVFILDEADHEVSLGTTIDADGWIMTPVSTLPATPRCRLPDSRVVPARGGDQPRLRLGALEGDRGRPGESILGKEATRCGDDPGFDRTAGGPNRIRCRECARAQSARPIPDAPNTSPVGFPICRASQRIKVLRCGAWECRRMRRAFERETSFAPSREDRSKILEIWRNALRIAVPANGW